MSHPPVHQVLASLAYGDAIGHEVIGIQRVLREAGYRSDIFVETVEPRVAATSRHYRDLIGACTADDVLIHHFSIGAMASRVAYALPAKMLLVYHNITPPQYFLGVHPQLVQQCFMGRRELSAYADRCVLAVGDSEYNRRELEALGFPHTGVLPVVPDFSHLDVMPQCLMAGGFDDDWTNILFVGRVVPSKKIDDLIRFFHAYRTLYNPRSRLLLVGSHAGFESYYAMLQQLVVRLRTPDVFFFGHVSNEELTAFYDVADLFLCASEHEGFCVPLVEAFYKRVPVIAYAAAAVPATLDGAGLLYDTKVPVEVAALMDTVLQDEALQARLVAGQDAALERLQRRDFARLLLQFVERAIAAPPRTPHVTPDFWQQFERNQRLGEIRQYRPAAFLALPYAEGESE
jgi:glycosyltransferase involved in cell wall biosynthesis